MILILSAPWDGHADHVEQKLRQRGAGVVRFNPADFPLRAAVSLSHGALGGLRHTLRVGEQLVDLTALDAVWYRRPEPPVAHENITDGPVRTYVEAECWTFIQDS